MSANIVNNFLKYKNEELHNYAQIILEDYYDKTIFTSLINKYTEIRYLNIDNDIKSKRIIEKLNGSLIDIGKKMRNEGLDEDKINISLFFFGYVYYIDNVIKYDSNVELAAAINNFRKNYLGYDFIELEQLLKIINENRDKVKKYLKSFEDENFKLVITKTSEKYTKDVILKQNIDFPKLYSEYAINKVYTSGIINESKLLVLYYVVVAKIIDDVINLRYNREYLVEFTKTILEKKEKLQRLLTIIDSDFAKEKVIMKLNYTDYNEHKEEIDNLINQGYNFALYTSKMENDILFDLFKYVIVNNETYEKYHEKYKNMISINRRP